MKHLLPIVMLGLMGVPNLRAEYGAIAKVGDKPYSFTGVATDGSAVSLDALKGKVVMVYFFTTQPGAGMMELRQIQKYVWPLYKSEAFAIVGVGREAEAPELAKVSQQMQIGFPLIPDPKKEIFLHYASKGHPRAYLIGKDGTIKLVSLGYTDDEVERISNWIARALVE